MFVILMSQDRNGNVPFTALTQQIFWLIMSSLKEIHEKVYEVDCNEPNAMTLEKICGGEIILGLITKMLNNRIAKVVTVHQRSHTQNQGFSKVVNVYSEQMVESQVINLTKPNVRQENGQNGQGSVVIYQSKYKRAKANLKV